LRPSCQFWFCLDTTDTRFHLPHTTRGCRAAGTRFIYDSCGVAPLRTFGYHTYPTPFTPTLPDILRDACDAADDIDRCGVLALHVADVAFTVYFTALLVEHIAAFAFALWHWRLRSAFHTADVPGWRWFAVCPTTVRSLNLSVFVSRTIPLPF